MSEKQGDFKNDAAVDAYQSQYGKVCRAELDGKLFVFRRPNRAEITHFNKVARAQPELSVEHAIGLCLSCHVGPGDKAELNQAFNDYPLAFAGSQEFDGVSDYLIRMATGDANITVK